jgi:hypothetical protein
MAFQREVHIFPAPGIIGGLASLNPVATVDAGPGGLTAGTAGVYVGRFAWNTYAIAGGPGRANNNTAVFRAPDGFIHNEQQGLITDFMGRNSMLVPGGLNITEIQRGDFWARNQLTEAVRGNKVYANVLDAQITTAATGQILVLNAGSASAFTATLVAGSTNMNVTAVASGVLAIGQYIQGPGIPIDTYIESLDTGSGSTGKYNLSRAATKSVTATAGFTGVSVEPVGGASTTGSGTTGTNALTIAAVAYGQVAVGMLAIHEHIPAGTYVTGVGVGTCTLSANLTDTISSETITFSPWVETAWYANSPANVGELVKIGVRN